MQEYLRHAITEVSFRRPSYNKDHDEHYCNFKRKTHLSGIWRMILQYLNGDDLVGAFLPAFYHLTESASTQKLQHFILIGHGIEHLMLNQLIVAVGAWARACGSQNCWVLPVLTDIVFVTLWTTHKLFKSSSTVGGRAILINIKQTIIVYKNKSIGRSSFPIGSRTFRRYGENIHPSKSDLVEATRAKGAVRVPI